MYTNTQKVCQMATQVLITLQLKYISVKMETMIIQRVLPHLSKTMVATIQIMSL